MDALICRESGSAPFADYGCQMMPASQFIPNHSLTCHKLLKPWFWPIKKQLFLSQTNRGGLFVDLPKV